jgi:hypothetical protein
MGSTAQRAPQAAIAAPDDPAMPAPAGDTSSTGDQAAFCELNSDRARKVSQRRPIAVGQLRPMVAAPRFAVAVRWMRRATRRRLNGSSRARAPAVLIAALSVRGAVVGRGRRGQMTMVPAGQVRMRGGSGRGLSTAEII